MDDDEPLFKKPRMSERDEDGDQSTKSQPSSSRRTGGPKYVGITIDGNSRAHLGDVHNTYNISNEKSVQDRFVESLNFKQMDARLNNIKSAILDTCDWFFNHDSFIAWSDNTRFAEHHGFLWVRGKPASGKSTIMKTVWERAIEKSKGSQRKKPINLSYFFNGRAHGELEKSTLGLYRSLVHQLLRQVPDLKVDFVERFLTKDKDGGIEAWTDPELCDYLTHAIKEIRDRPISLFIDALDEGDRHEVRQMVEFLQILSHRSDPSLVGPRICLASRHYPHIGISQGLSLRLEDQLGHQRSIERYVEWQFKHSGLPEGTELQNGVCSKAGGVFLWVKIVVGMLKEACDDGKDIDEMKKFLAELPEELEELFAEILPRTPEDQESCTLLLRWVFYSTRPMSPTELYLAIKASRTETNSNLATLPNKSRIDLSLLSFSRGLVEETKSSPSTIQFIHESVRDFLKGRKGFVRLQHDEAADIAGIGHNTLKEGCQRYICGCGKPSPKQQKTNARLAEANQLKLKFPFLQYAVDNLLVHANYAQNRDISQQTFLDEIVRGGQLYKAWLLWSNKFQKIAARQYKTDTPLLYALTECNLPDLAEALIQLSVDINAIGGLHGTAINAACYLGHQEMIRVLLQNGADVSIPGGKKWKHAWDAAITARKDQVLRMLCESCAPDDDTLRQVLDLAMGRPCFIRGVQVLFEFASEKLINENASKALVRVASERFQRPQLNTIDMLLDKGARINCQEGAWTPLYAASIKSNEKVVRHLIYKGADVNQQNGYNDTALERACKEGAVEVVRALLRHGANVNVQGSQGRCALVSACALRDRKDCYDIVKMLLDRKAAVNVEEDSHGTALQAAASSPGHAKVIKMLVDSGADVNVKGGWHGSALRAAIFAGDIKAVQVLLDAGADVRIPGRKNSGSVLRASKRTAKSRRKPDKLRELLISYGAEDSHEEYDELALSPILIPLFPLDTDSE